MEVQEYCKLLKANRERRKKTTVLKLQERISHPRLVTIIAILQEKTRFRPVSQLQLKYSLSSFNVFVVNVEILR